MTQIRIKDAANLLGVSDDTIRRWIEDGALKASVDESGRKCVDGAGLAHHAQQLAKASPLSNIRDGAASRSARNHFTGLITKIVSDKVMSQVEVQAGPFRVVSLISTEAVHELGLKVGSVTTAVVKATNVSLQNGV